MRCIIVLKGIEAFFLVLLGMESERKQEKNAGLTWALHYLS